LNKYLILETLDYQRNFDIFLGNDGIFIYPTHPEAAPKHNVTLLKFINCAYTGVFNTLNVAVTQVPLGLNSEGLPIGVQVVAAPYNDHLTIAVAEELEKQFGGWVPSCQINC
jgi:fatty acid amide hydrolase 2